MHKSMLRISKSITRPSHVSTNAKSVETTTSQQNSNNEPNKRKARPKGN